MKLIIPSATSFVGRMCGVGGAHGGGGGPSVPCSADDDNEHYTSEDIVSMEHELQIMARLNHPNVVCHLGREGRRLRGVLVWFGLGYNPW